MVQPRKTHIIEKRHIDQEDEINDEIEREIEKSRIRRAHNRRQKEQRNIVEHHPRYVETNRQVEEDYDLPPYDRYSTYDVVDPAARSQNLNESYIARRGENRVTNTQNVEYPRGGRVQDPVSKSTAAPVSSNDEYPQVPQYTYNQREPNSNRSTKNFKKTAQFGYDDGTGVSAKQSINSKDNLRSQPQSFSSRYKQGRADDDYYDSEEDQEDEY